jgi:hypothetical protein
MKPENPRTFTSSTTKRDAIIATLCGLLILGFIIYGIMNLGSVGPGNRLSGTITAKRFTPAPEQQIEFGGKSIKSKKIEGEYLIEVRVAEEDRMYEVPVTKSIYDSKAVGDILEFIRPPSEQR